MPGAPYIREGLSPSWHEPVTPPAGSMTFYDLLRHHNAACRWASEEERRAADAFVDQLEQVGAFGNLLESLRSEGAERNV